MIGRRPLIGATNQNPSAIAEFTMTWKSTDGSTVINASASAIFQSGSLKHEADIKRLRDGKGARCTVISTDETLTLDVTAVPVGAVSASTLADAIKAATLPPALGFCTIANAPVIPMGPYADALNSANWMYEGGGSIEISNENEWALKFTVTRSNIAAQAAVDL
jgi:hypothetical protein